MEVKFILYSSFNSAIKTTDLKAYLVIILSTYDIMPVILPLPGNISENDNDILLRLPYTAKLARKLFEHMRREAASIRVQKHARAHRVRKYYTELQASALVIQTGLRAMAARDEYRRRRRAKAATIIQVNIFWLENL